MVGGGWLGVEGDFSVQLRSKPLVSALDLDLDQAEQLISYRLRQVQLFTRTWQLCNEGLGPSRHGHGVGTPMSGQAR